MVRHGLAVVDWQGQAQPVRLHLTPDTLSMQKEELVYTHSPEHIDPSVLNTERTVSVRRERIGGLGLSVKGGAEHNLPVLVSRIFKDQAEIPNENSKFRNRFLNYLFNDTKPLYIADKTGRLFVGDAIIKVNGENIETYCHDDAVIALKNAGEEVSLTVKYFRPASFFLAKTKRNSQVRDEENNTIEVETDNHLERQWTDILTMPLQGAYLTRYKSGTDEYMPSGFELLTPDGTNSGEVQCDSAASLQDWIQCITLNINALNNQMMALTNRVVPPSDHIIHMTWVGERSSHTNKLSEPWQRQYLALKGPDVLVFDTVPMQSKDWMLCNNSSKIYECMFRVLKDSELVDGRHHCFVLETGQNTTHYMSVESREELLKLEKAWYRANYQAIKHIGSKTFGCTWRSNLSGLTLDLNGGFSLYDSNSKTAMWSYRFSQLKGSSDDGHMKLTLHFLNDISNQLEMREVECTNLQTLLFSIHAFLSAKLASVDPNFLMNS